MNIGRILFFAIFVFSVSAVLAVGSTGEKLLNEVTALFQFQTEALEQELNPQKELKESYQNQLLEVLKEFGGSDESYRQLTDSLLALTVPAEYKELHLSLVAAIDGLAGGQLASVTVKANLERLKQTYGWLTANLSLFIANNF